MQGVARAVMMRGLGLAVLLTALACGGSRQVLGRQPSWRASFANVGDLGSFAPSGTAAISYAIAPSSPSHSAIEAAVIERLVELARAEGAATPVVDGRLSAALDDLAVRAAADQMPHAVVDFALRHYGLIEPAPFLLVVQPLDLAALTNDATVRLREMLAQKPGVRVGVGSAPEAETLLIGIALVATEIMPVPRRLAADASLDLRGRILPPFSNPEIVVTRSDGTVEDLASQRGDAFSATMPCLGQSGKKQIEVIGHDASGSTVLANFPVWCGVEPPVTMVAFDHGPAVSDPDLAERELLALMNAERAARQLAPLVWEPAVAKVARAYSYEMQTTGNVGHISTLSGDAADRVRKAGVQTGLVMENVARAYAVREAHDALMNSPGHRGNIVSPLATHVGVGVVLGAHVGGRRELFVTQVFTRVPPTLDVDAAANRVHERLRSVRSVTRAAALERAAQTFASDLARGVSVDAAWSKVAAVAKNGVYAQVESMTAVVADVSAASGQELLGQTRGFDVGVGVAQGRHPDLGDGAIWVVVLVGTRR